MVVESAIQALDRTQPMLPLRPGQVERRTHDYKRHGTASLYAAFDFMTGQVIGRITQRHRAKELLAFLQQIERSTPVGLDLHVILDNSSTHKTAAIKQWLEKHPRFKLHFTPPGASWLNAVEGGFAQLERRALYRGAFTSVANLKALSVNLSRLTMSTPPSRSSGIKRLRPSLAGYIKQC